MGQHGEDNFRATAGSPDLRNSRPAVEAKGQRKEFRAIAERQNRKMPALAEHIVPPYPSFSFYRSTA
jgi:hypothetical protein